MIKKIKLMMEDIGLSYYERLMLKKLETLSFILSQKKTMSQKDFEIYKKTYEYQVNDLRIKHLDCWLAIVDNLFNLNMIEEKK